MKKITPILTSGIFLMPLTSFGTVSIVDMFQTHNAVVFENLNNVQHDIEGRILVGGTLTISQSTQFGFNSGISNTTPIITAHNEIIGNSWININQGSILSRTQSTPLNVNFNSGGSLVTGQTAWDNHMNGLGFQDIDDMWNQFQNYSQFLNKQQSTGSFDFTNPNQYVISGNGDAISYVTVNGLDLSTAKNIRTNLNGSSTLVINILGEHINIDAIFLGGSNRDIIWNFLDATTVDLNGPRMPGSIFAPDADVYAKGGYSGLMVAKNLSADDEGYFNAISVSIPECSSSLILISLVILQLLHRKR